MNRVLWEVTLSPNPNFAGFVPSWVVATRLVQTFQSNHNSVVSISSGNNATRSRFNRATSHLAAGAIEANVQYSGDIGNTPEGHWRAIVSLGSHQCTGV